MTDIYSTSPNFLSDDKTKKESSVKPELSKEDQLFFDSLKRALHGIEKEPSRETILSILKHSKSS